MTEQTKAATTLPEILIVEDSAIEAELLRRSLARAGYHLTMAKDGEAGLEAARASRPDLIVSDINMPLMNGYELSRAIKYDDELWNIPVILLTIMSEPEDIMEALNSGADGYITKPFVEEILLERIQALLSTPSTRKRDEERRSEQVQYNNDPYTITGGSQQVLNMLFSVYEGSLFQNRDLTRVQSQLNLLNESLDAKVTERTAELARTNRTLRTLSAGNQALVRATSETELLQTAVGNIVGNGGYGLAEICYGDNDGEKSLQRVATTSSGEDLSPLEAPLTWADTNQMPCARAMRSGKTEVCGDIANAPGSAPWRDAPLARGYVANIALPLTDNSTVFGVLSIYSSEADSFDETEIKLLNDLAKDLAYGIVTLRGRAEMQQLSRHSSLILSSTGEGIFGLDLEGRITFINPAGATMLQRSAAEVLGQIAHDLHHHTRGDNTPFPRDTCPIYAAYRDGAVHQLDDELFWRKDGTSFPVEYISTPMRDEQGEMVGAVVAFSDISQRKQAEELIQNILECVDEGFLIIDRDFRILSANRAYSQLVDRPLAEIIGSTCYETYHHVTAPCDECGGSTTDCPVQLVFTTGEPHSALQHHEDAAGGGVYREAKAYPYTKDSGGRVETVIETIVDVSQLYKLEAQLRQAQKMEAIGTLAGGIAHDFNNILSPILGYSEMVQEMLPLDSEERGMVQEIRTAGLRAKDLVKQILTFSRKGEEEPQPVQIHLIIKEALKLLHSSIPTTISIHQEVGDCGLVMADPTQIHQVLMNLCTNGYHAMLDTGGEMSVSLAVVELTGQDVLDELTVAPGPHVKLCVRDTGCGIAKGLQERIFDPYFTTKPQGEGTGLGLSVVRGIVQGHHGHITMDSKPGRGTEFCVYLPQVKLQDDGSVETNGNWEIPRGSGTVLVVDDEPVIRRLHQRLLLGLGYEVLVCANGAEALETFQQHSDGIDLVLTDMAMPKMNGAELTLQIKQLSPATPVVLCTGYSDSMDEKKAKEIGIDRFLVKPVNARALAQTLHELMAKKGVTGSGS
ncbi:MAG: response regulator [Desulfobulbaceae bacterium]|jgi:PAS domain S-box-containing protein|nr:response regulator [Desulfobulbaceae bacterium]